MSKDSMFGVVETCQFLDIKQWFLPPWELTFVWSFWVITFLTHSFWTLVESKDISTRYLLTNQQSSSTEIIRQLPLFILFSGLNSLLLNHELTPVFTVVYLLHAKCRFVILRHKKKRRLVKVLLNCNQDQFLKRLV